MFVHGGEEMLYLLEGEILMTFGKERYGVTEPGTCIYIDASVPHRADCRGEAEALVLVVLSQDLTETPFEGGIAGTKKKKEDQGGEVI
jgi:mannose-6-phosphate isomerase-like protein (cupin superfamily)